MSNWRWFFTAIRGNLLPCFSGGVGLAPAQPRRQCTTKSGGHGHDGSVPASRMLKKGRPSARLEAADEMMEDLWRGLTWLLLCDGLVTTEYCLAAYGIGRMWKVKNDSSTWGELVQSSLAVYPSPSQKKLKDSFFLRSQIILNLI